MNNLELFLYKNRIINLGNKKIERWIKNKDVKRLSFGLINGTYDIRLLCLEAFDNIAHDSIIEILLFAINDNIRIVSEKAIEKLSKLDLDENLIEIITKKKEYWKRKEEIELANHSKKIDNPIKTGYSYKNTTEKINKRYNEQQNNNRMRMGGL